MKQFSKLEIEALAPVKNQNLMSFQGAGFLHSSLQTQIQAAEYTQLPKTGSCCVTERPCCTLLS